MFKSIFLLLMHICFDFTKWNLEANGKWEKGNFILGPKGSEVCSEGTPIMDATACREACGTLDIPQREIYGFNKCYKETKHRHERCYQNGQPGSGARMICIKSELISGRFNRENENTKSF